MERQLFIDYLIERQIREDDEKIKVDPAQKAVAGQAQTAVARTLKTSDLDLRQANTDPRVKNQFLATALAKARGAGAKNVNVKTIAHTVDPTMKV